MVKKLAVSGLSSAGKAYFFEIFKPYFNMSNKNLINIRTKYDKSKINTIFFRS